VQSGGSGDGAALGFAHGKTWRQIGQLGGLMSAVSLIPIFVVTAIALLSIHWLDKLWPLPEMTERASTIDGLRGYLALGVFLHHACIWHFFLQSGQWQAPPSRVYTHLGQICVSLFFMITGFLFFVKLLKSKRRSIDWIHLYVSRSLRILPLFLTTIALVFLVYILLKYGVIDSVNSARYGETSLMLQITAGVRWTLSYEWRFYFFLPFLALVMWRQPPWSWVIIGSLCLSASGWRKMIDIHGLTFLGGMLAAKLTDNGVVNRFALTPAASISAITLLVTTIAVFDTAYALIPSLLLGGTFILIANGTSLFGLLNLRSSNLLGHVTFGVYLLHGMVLFFLFRVVLGYEYSAQLSPLQHWVAIFYSTPFLIGVTFLAFKFIESPAMAKVKSLSERLYQISWLRALRS
jgi:peptidoglycan/LPS O-acetylase OafA/YrhL